MKKSELQALGLDDKTIRAVQEIHGRDITKLARKAQDPGAAAVREAIKTMLPMVKSIDSLSRILREVNYQYYVENRPAEDLGEPAKEKTARGADNTTDGKETPHDN